MFDRLTENLDDEVFWTGTCFMLAILTALILLAGLLYVNRVGDHDRQVTHRAHIAACATIPDIQARVNCINGPQTQTHVLSDYPPVASSPTSIPR